MYLSRKFYLQYKVARTLQAINVKLHPKRGRKSQQDSTEESSSSSEDSSNAEENSGEGDEIPMDMRRAYGQFLDSEMDFRSLEDRTSRCDTHLSISSDERSLFPDAAGKSSRHTSGTTTPYRDSRSIPLSDEYVFHKGSDALETDTPEEGEVKGGAEILKLQRHLQHLQKVFNCFVPSGYQVRYA
jgi:hypothetical protein